jgi:hypothetical protein
MMAFLLALFTVVIGLFVVVLLAAALAAIWRGIRGDDQLKKIERERDQQVNTH